MGTIAIDCLHAQTGCNGTVTFRKHQTTRTLVTIRTTTSLTAAIILSASAAHAASVPYLRLWGLVAGGWQLARGARAASARLAEGGGDADFYRGKIATARFYADCLLPQAAAWSQAITLGSEAVLALADAQF